MRLAFYKMAWRVLALLIGLFITAQTVSATTVAMPPDDDLIIGARAIVRAKVLDVGCSLDDTQNRIYTYVTLRVREVIKGQITTRRIVLKEFGGQVGDRGSRLFGAAEFQPGEEVLLYLDTWNDGSLRVHQMFLGKFSIITDARTGERLVVRQQPEANTVVLEGEMHTQSARGPITNRMELGAYTAMVRARLAVNRAQADAFEKTYYRHIKVLAEPVDYSRAASRGIQPMFTFITNPPVRWFEPDNGQPVVFLVNPDGTPNPEIMDDLSAAMAAWSEVPDCTLRVVNGGSTTGCLPRDESGIIFNNCDGRFAPGPNCASILALGGVEWDSSQRKSVNGTSFVRGTMGHVSFNPYAACDFNDHCKVREIATHELGHALGLGHSQYPEATMFGVAHFDGRCASLKPDDQSAVAFMYPTVDAGPQPLAITTDASLPVGILAVTYTPQIFNASGGSRPYSWAIVSPGAGRLPPGLSFGAGGIIGGIPIEAGTYNFTVRVTDASHATLDKNFTFRVITPSGPFDSQFISQTVPTTVQPNQTFSVNLKWMNMGSQVWDGANGLKLRAQNPASNTTWGGDTVLLPSSTVALGQQLDATFTAIAPRNFGTYNFQWQLYQEGVGLFGQMSANVQITVTDGSSAPTITSAAAVDAMQGQAFNFPLTVSNGSAPFAWSVAGGALPDGLTLNATSGLLAGTPTATGSTSFSVRVTDAQSRKAEKTMTVTVLPPAFGITTGALANGQQGAPFAQTLAAAGGKPPYTWAVVVGGLPTGLTLNATTGVLSGTPTTAGSYSLTIEAKDADSHTARKAMSITVAPPALSLETATLLEAAKGEAFSYQPGAAGGRQPYIWAITAGALPAGLSLNTATGQISGIPTAVGAFTASLTVRDQDGRSATGNVQIKTVDPATIPLITRVKYKSHKKLKIDGERIDPAATLMVDGVVVSAKLTDGTFLAKKLPLPAGRHEVRIMNPGNVSSLPYILTVN